MQVIENGQKGRWTTTLGQHNTASAVMAGQRNAFMAYEQSAAALLVLEYGPKGQVLSAEPHDGWLCGDAERGLEFTRVG